MLTKDGRSAIVPVASLLKNEEKKVTMLVSVEAYKHLTIVVGSESPFYSKFPLNNY